MSEGQVWYVAVQGQQQGPFTLEDVVAGLREGRYDRSTHVFRQGMDGWSTIGDRDEFAGALGTAVAPPPPPSTAHRTSHEIDYELFGSEMQFVEITLDPQEACIAEAGGMMYMDPGIKMETIFGDGSAKSDGGGLMGKFLGAGKRLLTGESLFMTIFANVGHQRQKVAFASPYPGKILAIDLSDHNGSLLCQKDAFLAAAKGISVGIALQRKLGAGFFGGEGFILQKLEGDGLSFVHAGGTILSRDLEPGESLRVDTGCIVAFEERVNYDIQFVGGIKTAVFGGEGLFYATLTGPGRIWLQSLPFSRLAGRVFAAAPQTGGRRKGEGSILDAVGGLGNLLDGD